MRYLENPSFDPEMIERAEAIFERLLGYPLLETEHTETLKYMPGGVSIKNVPVHSLVRIRARTSDGGHYFFDYGRHFGSTDWIEIDPTHVLLFKTSQFASVTLPPSIFGTPYEEVEIIYRAGLKEAPVQVQHAIVQIAKMLVNGEIDEWHCFLPDEVLDVIESYRKEESA
jgi:hypothetical protein